MERTIAGRRAPGAAPGTRTVGRGVRGTLRRCAPALAALLMYMGAAAPAWAMTVLEAADHAELEARIAAGAVTRIALTADRVKKVIRAPDGLRVEHDAATGDLYLTPSGLREETEPAALFVVTEKGFTYRLTLTAADGGSAQILIRNAAAMAVAADGARESAHRRAGRARSRGGAPRAAGGVRDRGRRRRDRRPRRHRDLAGRFARGARGRGAGRGRRRRARRAVPLRRRRMARRARHRTVGRAARRGGHA